MATRNRSFAKLAKDIDPSGNIKADGISSDVSLGTDIYDSFSLLPMVGNEAGDQAFVSDTSRLYIHSGAGWYNIALINRTPTVASIQDSDGETTPFTLAVDGTATRITITAADSDGDLLTYNATADSDFAGLATLSQASNVFTITPFSEDSATTESGTITFSVTDGINTATPAAQTFTLSFGSDWTATTQQQKIVASDASADAEFGYSVAISGDTAIVGAYRSNESQGSDAGSAYIFTRSGSTWTQQQKIQSSDLQAADLFGISVGIDGDTAVVGARNEDTGGSNAGAAYVFTRTGSTWTQQQKIQGSDVQEGDLSSRAVAISGDTIIFGAHAEDAQADDAGAAYIFTRSGSTWTQQQKIVASDAEASDLFGESVAIDGDTVVVGAYTEDTGGSNAGATYIFTRSGSTWTQQQKIQASDAAADDQFGFSVSISGDSVIVGARNENSEAGAAYIFTRSGSTWTEQQKIVASDAAAGDIFGYRVAIDGNTVIASSPNETSGGSDAGAAYIFTRDGSTWTQQIKIQSSDIQADDHFGSGVAIDGDTVIVGAYDESSEASDAGAAYIFVGG